MIEVKRMRVLWPIFAKETERSNSANFTDVVLIATSCVLAVTAVPVAHSARRAAIAGTMISNPSMAPLHAKRG